MNDLESHLLASRRVRSFLQNFSETQWNRVMKATVMLGIQELEKQYGLCLNKLAPKDLEDIVGKSYWCGLNILNSWEWEFINGVEVQQLEVITIGVKLKYPKDV